MKTQPQNMENNIIININIIIFQILIKQKLEMLTLLPVCVCIY